MRAISSAATPATEHGSDSAVGAHPAGTVSWDTRTLRPAPLTLGVTGLFGGMVAGVLGGGMLPHRWNVAAMATGALTAIAGGGLLVASPDSLSHTVHKQQAALATGFSTSAEAWAAARNIDSNRDSALLTTVLKDKNGTFAVVDGGSRSYGPDTQPPPMIDPGNGY